MQRKALLTRCEVGNGSNCPENPCEAATDETTRDECVAELVSVRFGIDFEVFVATGINHVATRSLSAPVKRHGASLALLCKINLDCLRQQYRGSRSLVQNNWCCGGVGCAKTQHVLSRQFYILRPQMKPILIQLISRSSCPRRSYVCRVSTQRKCDPRRRVVAAKLLGDAATEVKNTLFHEGVLG